MDNIAISALLVLIFVLAITLYAIYSKLDGKMLMVVGMVGLAVGILYAIYTRNKELVPILFAGVSLFGLALYALHNNDGGEDSREVKNNKHNKIIRWRRARRSF